MIFLVTVTCGSFLNTLASLLSFVQSRDDAPELPLPTTTPEEDDEEPPTLPAATNFDIGDDGAGRRRGEERPKWERRQTRRRRTRRRMPGTQRTQAKT